MNKKRRGENRSMRRVLDLPSNGEQHPLLLLSQVLSVFAPYTLATHSLPHPPLSSLLSSLLPPPPLSAFMQESEMMRDAVEKPTDFVRLPLTCFPRCTFLSLSRFFSLICLLNWRENFLTRLTFTHSVIPVSQLQSHFTLFIIAEEGLFLFPMSSL